MKIVLISVLTVLMAVVLVVPGASADEFSLRNVPSTTPRASVLSTISEEPNNFVFQPDDGTVSTGTLSVKRAVLYSLVLPGWGDLYAGRPGRASVFFFTEAAIWTAFAVTRVQEHRRVNSYEELAVLFAGVSSTGKSDDFYAQIREYDSHVEYEAFLKANGRAELCFEFACPEASSESLEKYYLENRVADFEKWNWTSLERRVEFFQLRSSTKTASRRSKTIIAIAVAHRVTAAVFAVQAVRSQHSDEQARSHWNLDVYPSSGAAEGRVASLSWTKSF